MKKFFKKIKLWFTTPYVPPKSVEIAGKSLGRIAEEMAKNDLRESKMRTNNGKGNTFK